MLKKYDKTWVVHQIHDSEILERFLNPGVQCESQSSLAESAILKYVGLGATADPAGSKSIWWMCQSMRLPLIVISSECTNLSHEFFYFNVL